MVSLHLWPWRRLISYGNRSRCRRGKNVRFFPNRTITKSYAGHSALNNFGKTRHVSIRLPLVSQSVPEIDQNIWGKCPVTLTKYPP
jgi:hypothetical protein